MEITINLAGLQRHKDYYYDEEQILKRIEEMLTERCLTSQGMGSFYGDGISALKVVFALSMSLKKKMIFLDTLEENVLKANRYSGYIVDYLI